MNLIVDVGNTLVKVAVFGKSGLTHKETAEKPGFETVLNSIFKAYPGINNAILSVVGSFSSGHISHIEKICPVLTVTPEMQLPFINKYATPQTLGVDRIALASAACTLYPDTNVLVIDAGSCVTYDFINTEGHYLGGAISPGITMRYKALHTFTEKLPLLATDVPKTITGNSTAASIHSGIIFGICFEIDGAIDRYKKEYKDLTVILTGGDAHFLRENIKNTIFANSNFLIEGLNCLLEFNKDK